MCSPVHGQHVASYDTSLVVSGGDDCQRERRNVYDKKPQRYAKDNRTAHLTARARSDKFCSVQCNLTIKYSWRFLLLKLTDTKYRAASLRQQSYLYQKETKCGRCRVIFYHKGQCVSGARKINNALKTVNSHSLLSHVSGTVQIQFESRFRKKSVSEVPRTQIIYNLPPTKHGMFLPEFVCLSVCLWERLLKNACMDLYEMLRVDRCREMDELINFWARSGS